MFKGCVDNAITSVQYFTLDSCITNGNGTGVVLNEVIIASILDYKLCNNIGKTSRLT